MMGARRECPLMFMIRISREGPWRDSEPGLATPGSQDLDAALRVSTVLYQ
jgi:hypothetical protein